VHVSADSVQSMQGSILARYYVDVSLVDVRSDVRVTLRPHLDVRDVQVLDDLSCNVLGVDHSHATSSDTV